MSVVASGPPFWANPPLCECGWMWAKDCDYSEKRCGLKNGMPEYEPEIKSEFIEPKNPQWNHTPYEFLEESVDLDRLCREVVEDLVKEKTTLRDDIMDVTNRFLRSQRTQVGGTHYAEMEVQPWDAMRAWMSPEEYIGYHIGTAIGYLSRHKKKGGEVDIDKALHHMKELSRYLKEDAEYPW